MASKLYYDPARPSSFGTLKKLQQATKRPPAAVKAWLEEQDAYTMHRRVRKPFPRNPYTVNNINDVWEYDLVDVQSLSKYNGGVKYLLTVIDVLANRNSCI